MAREMGFTNGFTLDGYHTDCPGCGEPIRDEPFATHAVGGDLWHIDCLEYDPYDDPNHPIYGTDKREALSCSRFAFGSYDT